MRIRYCCFLLPLFLWSTASVHAQTSHLVYHIPEDPKTDDPSFKPCNEQWINPYYGVKTGYRGDKTALVKHFNVQYRKPNNKLSKQSGYITIRFIVNCKGKTGRFRLQQFDREYNITSYPQEIVSQLLNLTRQLNGWVPGQYNGESMDSYYYLCFKIKEGEIAEILP